MSIRRLESIHNKAYLMNWKSIFEENTMNVSLVVWLWNVSIGSWVWTLAPHLVMMFGKVVKTLGGGVSLEQVGHWGGGGPEALESSPICCSHSAFGCGCNSKSQPPVLTAVQYLLPQWLPRGDGLDLYKTLIQKKHHTFLCQVFRNSNQKPLRQVTERQE